jgi:hypothetical protein
MKRTVAVCIVSAGVMLALSFCRAAADDQKKVSTSGFVGIEIGEIEKGHVLLPKETDVIKAWQERVLVQLVNDFIVGDHFKAHLAIEGQMAFSIFSDNFDNNSALVMQPWWTFYADRADGVYTVGNPDAPWLSFDVGYFPYKFNPDVKNLGEFIFRTGTYPPWVLNYFNRPYTRLMGLMARVSPLRNLNLDCILNSEAQVFPLEDFSLSFMGSYSWAKIIDVGAGVSFAHLFSIEGSHTDPKDAFSPNNRYVKSVTPINDSTIDTTYGYYTFKGTKPTARITLDPKEVLPLMGINLPRFITQEDGRIYAEVCVTGWDNYYSPVDTQNQFFRYRADRTLWMAGIHIPTCTAFDVLALEFEHYGMNVNSTYNIVNYMSPFGGLPKRMGLNPWKFSIYGKRTFLKNFQIVGQIARDHMKPLQNDPTYTEKEDVLERGGDWWWVVRLNVKF